MAGRLHRGVDRSVPGNISAVKPIYAPTEARLQVRHKACPA